jgi:hypothetical protein
MTFYYYVSYDEKRDDFFAMVDTGAKAEVPIFTIDTTAEVRDYIKTGVMKHIDDVDGLEKFLMEQGFLQPGDTLLLSETPLW